MARCGSAAAVLAALTACGGGDSGQAPPPPPPTPTMYTVGGTVTGLTGSGLVLQNGGSADLPISASGTFTFSTRMVSGTSYSVTVKTPPTSPLQYCQVANASGTVAAANVTNVSVTCGNGYTVGGTVSGLVGSSVVIQITETHLGGSSNLSDPLQLNSNGAFTFDVVFPGNVSGSFVAIRQQPASSFQLCVVNNAEINIQAANVTGVAVVCSQFSYVANAGDNTVSAYTVDATSGALAAVGTPVTTGTSPHAIAVLRIRNIYS